MLSLTFYSVSSFTFVPYIDSAAAIFACPARTTVESYLGSSRLGREISEDGTEALLLDGVNSKGLSC